MQTYSTWNTIYSHFDPVAFSVFGVNVHWYGIAYVCALVFALFVAQFFIAKFPARFPISKQLLDSYFLWAELGVIVGARIGYVAIYDPDRFWYLANPLEIFSPFDSRGEFVGIRGMSFHGGVIGFLLASVIFVRIKKIALLPLMDLVAISVPLAYIFGRVGNFLNQELFGRIVPAEDSIGQVIGIVINGTLRYPSQLLEALLEGVVVFIIVMLCARVKALKGALIGVYGVSYGLMRFIAEYWREPDPQLGLFGQILGGLSMGQILCGAMIICGMLIIAYAIKINTKGYTCTHKNS
ncbi:prolipoprotein diacylglyceryl transferase [Helicobacter sp.]|uniref:prolipoprotein diacylglyceryl transferase n=1 Tax=Helicobacter sp. TaxID=218 RepID=UPI00388DAB4C